MISNENQHQMKMDSIYESKKDFRKGETKNSPFGGHEGTQAFKCDGCGTTVNSSHSWAYKRKP